jgi:hypothetical protein
MMCTCERTVVVKLLGSVRPNNNTRDVTFVDGSANEVLNTQIDAAYESKYQRYSATYVDPMIAPQARATTLKLVLF